MADGRLRLLERRYGEQGDRESLVALLIERYRYGLLPQAYIDALYWINHPVIKKLKLPHKHYSVYGRGADQILWEIVKIFDKDPAVPAKAIWKLALHCIEVRWQGQMDGTLYPASINNQAWWVAAHKNGNIAYKTSGAGDDAKGYLDYLHSLGQNNPPQLETIQQHALEIFRDFHRAWLPYEETRSPYHMVEYYLLGIYVKWMYELCGKDIEYVRETMKTVEQAPALWVHHDFVDYKGEYNPGSIILSSAGPGVGARANIEFGVIMETGWTPTLLCVVDAAANGHYGWVDKDRTFQFFLDLACGKAI